MNPQLIFAIDFDGTCVEHDYPNVGDELPHCADVLRALAARGAKLILWTMRSGTHLDEAVEWFSQRDIPLWGVNENPSQKSWTSSPKVFAHVYLDDAAFGAPLTIKVDADRPHFDWADAGPRLLNLMPEVKP